MRTRTEHFRYVDLNIGESSMTITLNNEGRIHLAENQEQYPDWNDDDHFFDLIEDMLGNGWTSLRPEQIGALTSCSIILSPDVKMDDEGDIVDAKEIYWHGNYQVELACEALEADGLFLQYVGDTEPNVTPATPTK
jgi:hypothetical protein